MNFLINRLDNLELGSENFEFIDNLSVFRVQLRRSVRENVDMQE